MRPGIGIWIRSLTSESGRRGIDISSRTARLPSSYEGSSLILFRRAYTAMTTFLNDSTACHIPWIMVTPCVTFPPSLRPPCTAVRTPTDPALLRIPCMHRLLAELNRRRASTRIDETRGEGMGSEGTT